MLEPSEEQVDWVHNVFKKALVGAFETHKRSVGVGPQGSGSAVGSTMSSSWKKSSRF